MSRFKIHVQHISYGWCGIELFLNSRRIYCRAGYMGHNPLASLISICLEFYEANGNEEAFEVKKGFNLEEEPGAMRFRLRLDKSRMVHFDIEEYDDDKNMLEEWHEVVPFEDIREAVISEGFRVLNAFGLFGYYSAWMDNTEFPLSQLLRLTGKLKLEWDDDFCSSNLSNEIQCLSSHIEELKIKEETHYDECVIYYEAWQLQCCGDPFAVGDIVDWTCAIPPEGCNAHGIILDFEEEHHGFATHSIKGKVTKIVAERSEFPKGEREVHYHKAKTIQEEILKADGREKNFPNDETTDRTFWGYIVTLKNAIVKPLRKEEN